MYIYADLRS